MKSKTRSTASYAAKAASSLPTWLPWVMMVIMGIYLLVGPDYAVAITSTKTTDRDTTLRPSMGIPRAPMRQGHNNGAGSSTPAHAEAAWRRQAYLAAPFVHPQLYSCPKSSIKPINEWKSHAQKGEDEFLRDEIWAKYDEKDRVARTYIEIGGFDGIRLSTTMGFEDAWDWRGLLVEGHPVNSKALASNARLYRPNTAAITASICGVGDAFVPGAVHFTVKGGVTGTTFEHTTPEFMKRFNHSSEGNIVVDCLPMQTVLDSMGLQDVDFFSLDVEGAELIVLNTIDFDVTNIDTILVEVNADYPEHNKKVIAFLKEHEFELFAPKVGHNNQVWRNPHYEQVRQRRLSLPLDTTSDNSAPNTLMGRVYYEAGTAVRCA